MIFDWVDAICMGKQYSGQREQFMALPQESLLDGFEAVLEFHRYVAKRGYVAIDFTTAVFSMTVPRINHISVTLIFLPKVSNSEYDGTHVGLLSFYVAGGAYLGSGCG